MNSKCCNTEVIKKSNASGSVYFCSGCGKPYGIEIVPKEPKQKACECHCHGCDCERDYAATCISELTCEHGHPDPSLNTWEPEVQKISMTFSAIHDGKTWYNVAMPELDELINKQISLAVQKEREDSQHELKESKRTMAHIKGAKRVETDYVLLKDALAIINKGGEDA